MILLQIILIIAFLFILLRFLGNPNSYRMQAWQKLLGIFFFLMAIFSVLLPEKLNDIAHWFGVGRGADLMLYMLVLAFILVSLNTYVKEAEENKRMVRLVRSIALSEAAQNEHNQALLKKLDLV